MGGVRQNCSWIPRCRTFREDEASYKEKLVGCSSDFLPYENPDFLRTIRALGDYHDWVEARLYPIIGKFIEEHRDEIIENMDADQMNDMGQAIEEAYRYLTRSGWLDEQKKKFAVFKEISAFDTGQYNSYWFKQTEQFYKAEEEIKSNNNDH